MVLDRRLWSLDAGPVWIAGGLALPVKESADGIESGPVLRQGVSMTLELPDAETRNLTPEELRLELACALYARGRIGKVGGANLANPSARIKSAGQLQTEFFWRQVPRLGIWQFQRHAHTLPENWSTFNPVCTLLDR